MGLSLVHIKQENWGLGIQLVEPAVSIVTAWCGEQAFIFDDGEIIPGDFDFVMEMHANKASCERCKNIRRQFVRNPAAEKIMTAAPGSPLKKTRV